jgi:hypothetical protein
MTTRTSAEYVCSLPLPRQAARRSPNVGNPLLPSLKHPLSNISRIKDRKPENTNGNYRGHETLKLCQGSGRFVMMVIKFYFCQLLCLSLFSFVIVGVSYPADPKSQDVDGFRTQEKRETSAMARQVCCRSWYRCVVRSSWAYPRRSITIVMFPCQFSRDRTGVCVCVCSFCPGVTVGSDQVHSPEDGEVGSRSA